MSTEAVNFILNYSGFNTGDLKIFYDFESYSNGCVNSVESGNSTFSGQLWGYQSGTSFGVQDESQESLDLMTGTLGQVSLYGGVKITGVETNWYNQFIKIHNAQNMFSGNPFTFIIDGELLSHRDFGYSEQLPLHDKEPIFSNLSGISGWEFGLNGANRFYFKTYDAGQPKIKTHSSIPYGKNIWAIRHSNSNISISLYRPEDYSIVTETINMLSPLTNGGNWYIGSGLNSELNSITEKSNNQTSAIKLDNFLYFNNFLSDNEIQLFSRALKSSVSYTETVTSGYFSDVGSGVQNCTGISGLLYYTGILSGYNQTVSSYQTIENTPLYDTVQNEEEYLYLCDSENGIFSTNILLGTPSSLITGYTQSINTIYITSYMPVYYNSGVSGVVGSGCSLTYNSTGEYIYYTGTGYGFSGYNAQDIFPRSFSYFGPRNSGDFIDILTGTNSYSGTRQMANLSPIKNLSSIYEGFTLFEDLSSSGTNLSVNGQTQRYGSFSASTIYVSGLPVLQVDLEKDFSITGSEFILNNRFTGINNITNLWGVVDFNITGAIQELEISDTGDYTLAPFSEINPSGKQVFFNGQKIYEGINYSGGLNQFAPIGDISGATGIYFAIASFSGVLLRTGEVSGDNEYNFYSTTTQWPKSEVMYVNGLRIDYDNIIEHDINKDLISGIGVINTGIYSVATGVFEV